jgi:hypothetical protein
MAALLVTLLMAALIVALVEAFMAPAKVNNGTTFLVQRE